MNKYIAKFKSPKLMIAAGIVVTAGILLLVFSGNKPNPQYHAAEQQVWALAGNIRNFYRSRPDAWGLSTNVVMQNTMADAAMINAGSLRNVLGKEVLIGSDVAGNVVMPGSRSFVITYKNLNREECVAIAAMPINEKEQLGLTSMVIAGEDETRFVWGGENPLPITPASAKKSCGKNNLIAWFLYI